MSSPNVPANMSTSVRPGSASERTYCDAINLLNTCQSNAATIEAIRKSGGKMNQYSIPEMNEYLRRLGYKPEDLNALNVIHITGTKGKGSTSAFVERIFRQGMMEVGILPTKEEAVSKTTKKEQGSVEEEEAELIGGIGLYSSPHLCAVRERIRINGRPLPERVFAKYFFEVWDKFTAAVATESDKDSKQPSSIPNTVMAERSNEQPPMNHSSPHATGLGPIPLPAYPVYFRFLTLLAFHVFLSLRVRLTVLEVGVGGTYDSTNLVPRPLIAGVTSLGLDHTILLGNTIEEIALNKGGIYKRGVPALSIKQEGGKGEAELREMADRVGASSFEVVPVLDQLKTIKLGLRGKHQIVNASLAVALAKGVLASPSLPSDLSPLKAIDNASSSASSPVSSSTTVLPPLILSSLESARWPGRCQTVTDPSNGQTTWFLDGAHTVESLSCCGDWAFGEEGMKSGSDVKRILIFNCTNGRSAEQLLGALAKAGEQALKSRQGGLQATTTTVDKWFDHVIFCTNVTYHDGGFKGDLTSKAIDPTDLSALATQHAIADAWRALNPSFPEGHIHVEPSIEDAVRIVREESREGEEVDVLVAGSLHLVGGVIDVAGLEEVALSME